MARRNTDNHVGESGQILVMTALMLPVLIGFMALVLDAGYAFDYRRQAQTAVDSAALAGAYAVEFNSSISVDALEEIVRADATRNGFTHGSDGVTVTVYWEGPAAPNAPSPTNGGFEFSYVGDPSAVGVSISQPKAMFLMRVMNSAFANVTIGAKAVANKGGVSDINVIVLNGSSVQALWADLDSHMEFTGSVTVNSTAGNAADACGGCSINAAGGVFVTGNSTGPITPTPLTGFPPANDPFASLPAPVPGVTPGWSTATHPKTCGDIKPSFCSPGVYNDGIELGSGTYTFEAGNFFINGHGLHFSGNVKVDGTNVTIYNAGTTGTSEDAFELNSSGTKVQLTGPNTAGPYRSIVYFQGRDNTQPVRVDQAQPASDGGLQLNGVVYVPLGGGLQFFNGGSWFGTIGTAHAILITNLLQLRGGSLRVDNNFTIFGGSPLKKISLAE